MPSTDLPKLADVIRVKDDEFLHYLAFPEGRLMPLSGKRPTGKNWVRATHFRNSATVARCIRENLNMGFRIPRGVVVIDVDKKRGGLESFDRLCLDYSLDTSNWPKNKTGGGGFHLYLHVDPTFNIALELKDEYPGIEFRSYGTQVVCAGSVHPDTGEYYIHDTSTPDLHKMPLMPAELFDLIKKGQRKPRQRKSATQKDPTSAARLSKYPARLTPTELGRMLAGLDPMEHQAWSDFFKITCASHHATRGLGFEVNAEWAKRDFRYGESRSDLKRIWDGLNPDRDDGITIATLNSLLISSGRGDLAVPVTVPELDFEEDDDTAVAELSTEELSLREQANRSTDRNAEALRSLNEQCAFLVQGNKVRVVVFRDGSTIEYLTVVDFERLYANRIVRTADGNKKSDSANLGSLWLKWDARKEARGVTYDSKRPFFTLVDGKLNLWRGFSVTPDGSGSCKHFYELILNVICAGNIVLYEYIINWIAWKFQNPCLLPEVALALTGEKGVGKSMFADEIREIVGEDHSILVKQMDAVTGRFNGHFDGKALVIGDEVTWGGRRKDDGVIKNFITQKLSTVERKGVDMHSARHMVGLILLSNEEWIVPATVGERRYCAAHVSAIRKVPTGAAIDHENRLYWKRIGQEMKSGGRARFLYDMLRRPLGDWHPRDSVPHTEYLGRQILEGLHGYERGYYNLLMSAFFKDDDFHKANEWIDGTLQIAAKDLLPLMRWGNTHFQPTVNGLSRALKPFGWEHVRSQNADRTRLLKAPPLDEARRIFAKRIGHDPFGEDF